VNKCGIMLKNIVSYIPIFRLDCSPTINSLHDTVGAPSSWHWKVYPLLIYISKGEKLGLGNVKFVIR
jgi:hypothetical protein